MVAAVRGVSIEEVSDSISVRYGTELPLPVEVGAALEKRQAAHLDALLAGDEVGREVRRLEAEQERLLDTVWLAATIQTRCIESSSFSQRGWPAYSGDSGARGTGGLVPEPPP